MDIEKQGKYTFQREYRPFAKGSFGIVYRIKNISDGKIYVLKEGSSLTKEGKCELYGNTIVFRKYESIRKDIMSSEMFGEYTRLCPIYLAREDVSMFKIISHMLNGSTLSSLFKVCEFYHFLLSLMDRKILILNLLGAVYSLHNILHIEHNDIKPENIGFIDPVDISEPDTDDMKLKLANVRLFDYGLCSKFGSVVIHRGTPIYCPPELDDTTPHVSNGSHDLWSIGIIINQIMTCMEKIIYTTVGSLRNSSVEACIRCMTYLDTYMKPISIDDDREIKNILRFTLNVDPTKRYSILDIMKVTNFFNGVPLKFFPKCFLDLKDIKALTSRSIDEILSKIQNVKESPLTKDASKIQNVEESPITKDTSKIQNVKESPLMKSTSTDQSVERSSMTKDTLKDQHEKSSVKDMSEDQHDKISLTKDTLKDQHEESPMMKDASKIQNVEESLLMKSTSKTQNVERSSLKDQDEHAMIKISMLACVEDTVIDCSKNNEFYVDAFNSQIYE